MQLTTFAAGLPKPAFIHIEGARGSGKDATAHQLARILREEKENGKQIYININPKKHDLPDYFRRFIGRFHNDSILYLTDAELEYFATEWATDRAKTLVRLQSISRHKNIDMIWTSLLAADLPLASIRRLDATIYKEPMFRAEKYERKELQEDVEEAREFFRGKTKKEKLESAFAVTQKGKTKITGIKLPWYWTEELSRAHAGLQLQAQEKKPQVIKISRS